MLKLRPRPGTVGPRLPQMFDPLGSPLKVALPNGSIFIHAGILAQEVKKYSILPLTAEISSRRFF